MTREQFYKRLEGVRPGKVYMVSFQGDTLHVWLRRGGVYQTVPRITKGNYTTQHIDAICKIV